MDNSEWVLVPREPTRDMVEAGIMFGTSPNAAAIIFQSMVHAAPPPAAARGDVRGLEYVPGRLDREAPARVWLQIDTTGDNDERDDAWPGPEHVTWQDESIGGLEVQYVRADLALAAEGVHAGEVEQRPDARGVVDEAMVERALAAYLRRQEDGESLYGCVTAALTAALTGERNG